MKTCKTPDCQNAGIHHDILWGDFCDEHFRELGEDIEESRRLFREWREWALSNESWKKALKDADDSENMIESIRVSTL